MKLAITTGLLAVCLTAPVSADAVVTYTLELGGDNHRSGWKNPPGCNPPLFTSGSTADGQSFSGIITWAVRLSLSGTHSNGLVPSGVALFNFDLELRDSASNLIPYFGKGSATTPGFFSSINDGTPRSGCVSTTDPDQAAAFAVGFSGVNAPKNGRVIDTYPDGGPGLTGFQYPSTYYFPITSTAPDATLVGVSATYASFEASGCPAACGTGPGGQTAGVGYDSLDGPNCDIALGTGPVAEGQLNMASLPPGTYTLTVIPRATNLLNGDFDCQSGGPGVFAVPADATAGSTRSFMITSCDCCAGPVRTIVGRRIFYNNSFYDTPSAACTSYYGGNYPCSDDTAVPWRIVALLPGQAPLVPVQTPGPPISSASLVNYSSYTRGINGIMIDVQYGSGCVSLAGANPPRVLTPEEIAATFEFVQTTGSGAGRAVGSPYSGAVRVPQSVTIAPYATLGGADRIKIIFADDTSTNSSWLRTRVLATGVIDGLTPLTGGDGDRFYLGLAKAEGLSVATAGGIAYAVVNTKDQTDPKPPNNHTNFTPAPLNDEFDYNRNRFVDTADQTLPKPPLNTTTFTALSLGGTAP